MTPVEAGEKSRQWVRDYVGWRDMTAAHWPVGWDRMSPEKRVELEAIFTAGFDNITREKTGAPEMTDDEALAHARRWP